MMIKSWTIRRGNIKDRNPRFSSNVEVTESHPPVCTDMLRRVSHELQILTDTTESEFLILGEKLHGVSTKAQKISDKALSAANFLSGEAIIGAIEAHKEMLDQINNYLNRCEEQFEKGINILCDSIDQIDTIKERLEEFEKVAKKLRILGIATSIENARLNNDKCNFDNLVEDVSRLSEIVGLKCKDIYEKSKSLSLKTREELHNVTEMKEDQNDKAKSIFDHIQTYLSSLIEEHNLSSSVIKNISNQSHEISQRIGEIVVSMQFHDITRQKLEHVKKVLDNLIHTQDNKSEKEVIDICKLQSAQLQESKNKFLNAVENIMESLNGILHSVIDMSKEIQKLAARTNRETKSFLDYMESDITSVTSSLHRNIQEKDELIKLINSVAKMVGDMGSFIEDIDHVDSNIELVAINGLIDAAHLGEEGSVLSVIADSIQGVSADANRQTLIISDLLKNITTTTDGLSLDRMSEVDQDSMKSTIEEMIKDLDEFLVSIRQINDKVMAQLDQIDRATGPFVEEANTAVSQITVHNIFDKVLTEAVSILDTLIHQHEPESISHKILNAKNVEDMKKRYTMDSERRTHESLLTDEPKIQSMLAVNTTQENCEKELCNDIELF